MIEILKTETDIANWEELQTFLSVWEDKSEHIDQYTSGSTGTPKKISIPKWKMVASAKMTGDFLRLKDCKTALLCMSTQYIGGKMLVVRSLLYKLQLYVANVTRNPLQNIETPIDFVAMVPLQVEETLQKNPEKLNLIKYLIIGGAPVSDALIEKLKAYTCQAYATFGMTETVSHIALKSLNEKDAPYRVIGSTLLRTEDDCLVIDCDELKIKGLKTNDIVQLVDEHAFHWLGRADFVINSGGVKIHPEEVERKISSILANQDFIISWVKDPLLGSKVVFIGESHLNTEDLKERIDKVVAKYERPKTYYFISHLCKTASGKIDRNKTRAAIE